MPADLDAILKIEVPLVVQIASREMMMKDLRSLTPGAIIELNKNAEDELEILINNKSIGMGRAVKVGENFGVRIAYLGDLKERVEALSADQEK